MSKQNDEILAAVSKARRLCAAIPEGFGATLIAQGKTLMEAKAALFDRIAIDQNSKAVSKSNMIALVRQKGAPDAADGVADDRSRSMANMKNLVSKSHSDRDQGT